MDLYGFTENFLDKELEFLSFLLMFFFVLLFSVLLDHILMGDGLASLHLCKYRPSLSPLRILLQPGLHRYASTAMLRASQH